MAKALGRDYRKGASLMEFMQRYRTDAEAEAWFVQRAGRMGSAVRSAVP